MFAKLRKVFIEKSQDEVPSSRSDQLSLLESVCYISVRKSEGRGGGNGIFIAPDRVLTAWHILQGAQDVTFRNGDDDLSSLKKGGRHIRLEDKDLAVAELARPIGQMFLEPASTHAAPDKGFLMTRFRGYRADCIDVSLNYSLTSHFLAAQGMIVLDPRAKIVSGHSGSPIVDIDGRLVSIVHAGLTGAELASRQKIDEQDLAAPVPILCPHPQDVAKFVAKALTRS